ncbi:MAG: hypothetical protein E7576_07295 [Ruminococcaceae bacterium]|nr:hypothetical protein [Oscillospiraceae bacterium]
MNEELYTLTLADGTVIENVARNGDNYIVTGAVDTSVFEDNCVPLTISDGENEEIHENAVFVQAQAHGNETWLVFRDLGAAELREMRLRADVDYVAMMADIELEVE